MISDEMTNTSTPAEPYLCPHCDDTHEHEHVDGRAVVLAYRNRLALLSAVRLVLIILALVAVLVLMPPTAGLGFVGAGLAAWGLATVIGLAVAAVDLARRTRGSGQPRSSAREHRFITVSVLAGAAVTPVLALLVALAGRSWTDPGVPAEVLAVAGAAATGWLVGAGIADIARDWRLRGLLGGDHRAGEVARAAAVRLREQTHETRGLIAMVTTAVVLGLWVALCYLLPAAVIVLVPLQVVLVTLGRRLVSAPTRTG